MSISLPDKLKIRANHRILTRNAPGSFRKTLKHLPPGVTISDNAESADQVHWFVNNKSQLEVELKAILQFLVAGVIIWVYYPKKSSGRQTDLTRDKGWDVLLEKGNDLNWVSLISFDETWSVFGFRLKTKSENIVSERPKQVREIFKWADPKTKKIRLPEDLENTFVKNKGAWAFYETLSFTNKKEYIEWIVSAKQAETREARIAGTVEKLKNKWKNPQNR